MLNLLQYLPLFPLLLSPQADLPVGFSFEPLKSPAPIVEEVKAETPPLAVVIETPKLPKLVIKNKINLGFNPYSCISYIKYLSKIPQSVPVGNAWDIKPNLKIPKVGAWILTFEGFGHAAYIINFSDSHITFEEYNFIAGQKSVRSMDINDPRIKGYFDPSVIKIHNSTFTGIL